MISTGANLPFLRNDKVSSAFRRVVFRNRPVAAVAVSCLAWNGTPAHMLSRHQHNFLFIQYCLRNVRTWQVWGWRLIVFNTTTNRHHAGRGCRISSFPAAHPRLGQRQQTNLCAASRRTANGWLDRLGKERLLQSVRRDGQCLGREPSKRG